MATSNRWKCVLLMFIFIAASSSVPQRAANNSTYDYTAQHSFDMSNGESQIYSDLSNQDERRSDQQENDRSRIFIKCTLDIKRRKSECLSKCTNTACQIIELKNYFSACISGIKQKCTTITPTTPTEDQKTINCDQCGQVNTAKARRIGGKPIRQQPEPIRIVGGVEVNPHRKYPWQVSILNSGSQWCGGSIINNRWILTAAHCLASGLRVRVGEHDLSSSNDDDLVNTKTYSIRRSIREPGGVDIALLELTTEIPFNDVIRPICLPTDDSKTYAGVDATVSGWGSTIGGGPSSNILLEVSIPIDAPSKCSSLGEPINKICAGPKDGKDSCSGDSGGPLVVKEGAKLIQIGTVEKGPPDCGNSNQGPAVYIRVSKFLNWIKETTITGKCS